jgi:hypothetical protein
VASLSRVDASKDQQRLHTIASETIGMHELSSEGRKIVDDLAQRHGVGSDAVAALLRALELGNGSAGPCSITLISEAWVNGRRAA